MVNKIKVILICIIIIQIILSLVPINTSLSVDVSPTSKTVDRIIVFNTNKVSTSDCILIQSQGYAGIIDTSNRYSSQLTDYDGKVYEVTQKGGLSNNTEMCYGGSIANYMKNMLKITHLDFIIITHAHSDHIGGLEEVANSGLVNSNTKIFYKTYSHNDITNHSEYTDDDLPQDTLMSFNSEGNPVFYNANTGALKENIVKSDTSKIASWHNQAFLYAGMNACAKKGAKLIDISGRRVLDESKSQTLTIDCTQIQDNIFKNVSYQIGNTSNYYDDYISFNFGNFNFKLFNLYINTKLYSTENGNSIVTLITKDKKSYVSWGDLNVDNKAEQKIARTIKELVGRVDITKPGHHSTNAGSNALETYDLLQPKYAIGIRQAKFYQYWTSQKYGTVILNMEKAEDGMVFTFDDGGNITLNELVKENNLPKLNSIQNCLTPPEKIISEWNISNKIYSSLINSETEDWAYFDQNGLPVKGWQKINERWYYFDPNNCGLMVTGWIYTDSRWYYLSKNSNENIKLGQMLTGWQRIDGHWYYLSPANNGDIKEGQMLVGWQHLKGNNNTYWFYFCEKGVNQYSGFPQGSMLTGRHQVTYNGNTNWYYFCEKTGTPEGYEMGAMLSNITYGGHTYSGSGVDTSTASSNYTLTINPNGGSFGGKTTNSTISQKINTTKTLENPTVPTYTVTYNGNGGTTPSSQKVSGTFTGWTLTSGMGTLSGNVYTFGEGNATVTANYKNNAIVLQDAPTRDGYKFIGWYKEASCTNKIGDAKASYTPVSNITLYAKWEKDESQIINEDKTPPSITGITNNQKYFRKATPKITDENLNTIELLKDGEKVTSYTNGQEITSAGDYKLIATDKTGNSTIVNFSIYDIQTESYKEKTAGNEIYLGKINAGEKTSKIETLLKNVSSYKITRNGTEIYSSTNKNNNQDLYTGDKIEFESQVYTLIVTGDINKDGKANIIDLAKCMKVVLGKKTLDTIEGLAADTNFDGKVNIVDLAKIRKLSLDS